MAVWQYQLNIVPKKAILKKYGEIPTSLFIDYDGWKKYWENTKYDDGFPEPNFKDAKTIKWWTNIKVDIEKITEQIDQYITRGDWSDDDDGFIGWKGNTEKKEDNDGHIAYDKKTNIISEFQFRVDLRNKENIRFLKEMLILCQENEFMVFNTNGILFEPKLELIFEDLNKSNAAAFLTDPEKFLNNLTKNEKKQKTVSLWSKIKTFLK